jgi:serine/threonine protein kinase
LTQATPRSLPEGDTPQLHDFDVLTLLANSTYERELRVRQKGTQSIYFLKIINKDILRQRVALCSPSASSPATSLPIASLSSLYLPAPTPSALSPPTPIPSHQPRLDFELGQGQGQEHEPPPAQINDTQLERVVRELFGAVEQAFIGQLRWMIFSEDNVFFVYTPQPGISLADLLQRARGCRPESGCSFPIDIQPADQAMGGATARADVEQAGDSNARVDDLDEWRALGLPPSSAGLLLNETLVQFYAAELVVALCCLHDRGFVFTNLRPDNVYIGPDGHITLCNFSLQRPMATPDLSNHTHSIAYIAPEVLKGDGYTPHTDWWALGNLIYEMFFGTPPFYAQDMNRQMGNLLHRHQLLARLLASPPLSAEAASLLFHLLGKDGADRLPPASLKGHPFFHDLDWDRLAKKAADPPWRPPTATLREGERERTESALGGLEEEATRELTGYDTLLGFEAAPTLISNLKKGKFHGYTFVDPFRKDKPPDGDPTPNTLVAATQDSSPTAMSPPLDWPVQDEKLQEEEVQTRGEFNTARLAKRRDPKRDSLSLNTNAQPQDTSLPLEQDTSQSPKKKGQPDPTKHSSKKTKIKKKSESKEKKKTRKAKKKEANKKEKKKKKEKREEAK